MRRIEMFAHTTWKGPTGRLGPRLRLLVRQVILPARCLSFMTAVYIGAAPVCVTTSENRP